MKKYLILVLVIALFISVSVVLAAKPDFQHATVTIPAHAVKVAPGIFYLGTAMAVVWGIFSGPPSFRELVEWDQIYDDVDFDWSSDGEANKMDFENIATHELGHSVGLADLYEGACSEETMYGYASYGEIKKRSLEAGDIIGVKKLYGSN